MLKISRYGLLIALMAFVSSGHASQLALGDASNEPAVVQKSAPAVSEAASQINDDTSKRPLEAKYDLSGHPKAMGEPYQLPGRQPDASAPATAVPYMDMCEDYTQLPFGARIKEDFYYDHNSKNGRRVGEPYQLPGDQPDASAPATAVPYVNIMDIYPDLTKLPFGAWTMWEIDINAEGVGIARSYLKF